MQSSMHNTYNGKSISHSAMNSKLKMLQLACILGINLFFISIRTLYSTEKIKQEDISNESELLQELNSKDSETEWKYPANQRSLLQKLSQKDSTTENQDLIQRDPVNNTQTRALDCNSIQQNQINQSLQQQTQTVKIKTEPENNTAKPSLWKKIKPHKKQTGTETDINTDQKLSRKRTRNKKTYAISKPIIQEFIQNSVQQHLTNNITDKNEYIKLFALIVSPQIMLNIIETINQQYDYTYKVLQACTVAASIWVAEYLQDQQKQEIEIPIKTVLTLAKINEITAAFIPFLYDNRDNQDIENYINVLKQNNRILCAKTKTLLKNCNNTSELELFDSIYQICYGVSYKYNDLENFDNINLQSDMARKESELTTKNAVEDYKITEITNCNLAEDDEQT